MGQAPRGPAHIEVRSIPKTGICAKKEVVAIVGADAKFPGYPDTPMTDLTQTYLKAELEANKLGVYGALAATEMDDKERLFPEFPQGKPFYDEALPKEVSDPTKPRWRMHFHEFSGKSKQFVPDTTILEDLNEIVVLVDLPGMPDNAFYEDEECGQEADTSNLKLGVCWDLGSDTVRKNEKRLAIEGIRSLPPEMVDTKKYIGLLNLQTANRFEPFRMKLYLPSVVDHQAPVEKKLENGVLTLTLKREKLGFECKPEKKRPKPDEL